MEKKAKTLILAGAVIPAPDNLLPFLHGRFGENLPILSFNRREGLPSSLRSDKPDRTPRRGVFRCFPAKPRNVTPPKTAPLRKNDSRAAAGCGNADHSGALLMSRRPLLMYFVFNGRRP